MEGENIKIRQFLLGNAAPADDQAISRRILEDADFDERMSFAEETLIEDYLDHRLTADETRLFNENFLTSPARRELFEEISQLKAYARKKIGADSVAAPEEDKKPHGFWTNLFALNYIRPVAAAMLVLIVAIAAWQVFFRDQGLTETEKTYAALNARDLSNPSETGGLTTKSLISGTFRGGAAEAAKLTAADLTGDVLFRLALPPGTNAGKPLDLELTRGGQTVFRLNDLRVYQNPNGEELKVVLPKSVLTKGTYRIKLSNAATYDLTVE